MKAAGMRSFPGGATVPFDDPEIFPGATAIHVDNQLAVILDHRQLVHGAGIWLLHGQPMKFLEDEAASRT
ncbi:MAG: hypothetical protein U0176_03145 [Bacteroidia bacterium]